jgi:hypothetical protein
MNDEINKLTEGIIGAAIEVHREVGPGLLESAYQRALAHELRLRGLSFEEQRLTKCRIGLLLNFRSTVLTRGLKRLAL